MYIEMNIISVIIFMIVFIRKNGNIILIASEKKDTRRKTENQVLFDHDSLFFPFRLLITSLLYHL